MHTSEYQCTKENTLAISNIYDLICIEKCSAIALYLTIRENVETRYINDILIIINSLHLIGMTESY